MVKMHAVGLRECPPVRTHEEHGGAGLTCVQQAPVRTPAATMREPGSRASAREEFGERGGPRRPVLDRLCSPVRDKGSTPGHHSQPRSCATPPGHLFCAAAGQRDGDTSGTAAGCCDIATLYS